MKIHFANFGPINRCSFDLSNDIHIIFGKNNVGKSYAIIGLYCILKNLLQIKRRDPLHRPWSLAPALQDEKESLNLYVSEKYSTNNDDELDITKEYSRIISAYFTKYFLPELSRSLVNSFSSLSEVNNRNGNEKFSVILEFETITLSIKFNSSDNEIVVNDISLNKKIIVKPVVQNRRPVRYPANQILFYFNKNNNEIAFLGEFTNEFIHDLLTEVSGIVQDVYFLPASRSGLYQALNAFSAIIAELSQSRQFLRSKIELPNISEPLSDYYLNLSSIRETSQSRDNPSSKPFLESANIIENEILKGSVKFNPRTKKLSYIQHNIGMELDLSATSSMISEIAPIVAHLKFILAEKPKPNLIFIEEPEAHLHPEIQVKLVELFVRLCDNKTKIVMTSHSNYMLNKLSNLIIGKKMEPKRVAASLLQMTNIGSTVTEKSMFVSENGINDDNFIDIAENLYSEREHLLADSNK